MELPSSVHDHPLKNSRKRKGRTDKVKVVYISSPVKVTTCASRFMALVQELTGRDSDVSRHVEANNGTAHNTQQMIIDEGLNTINDSVSDSSTISDSYVETSFDDLLFNSHVQGGFLGMFPSPSSSNLLSFDQGYEFDGVVGGYGAV